MRVALVLPNSGAKRPHRRLRRDIAVLAAEHAVDVWAHPASSARVRKWLPGAHAVHEFPYRDAASVLAAFEVDLVVVGDAATARKAVQHLPLSVPVIYWARVWTRARARAANRSEFAELAAIASQLDGVLCSEPSTRAVLLKRLGPGTVPLISTTAGTTRRVSEVRAASGIREDERRLVGVGALTSAAGFGDVIRAFDSSGAAAEGWTLTLHGTGPHRESLRSLARWRGIEDAVLLEDDTSLEASLDRASLYVTPGSVPGDENRALELAERGVPVAGFEGDPVGALVAAAGGGILVPRGAYLALGAALSHLTSNTEALSEVRERAKAAAAELAATGVATAPWVSVIEHLAQRPSRRSEQRENARSHPTRDEALERNRLESAVSQALSGVGIGHARVAETGGHDAFVAAAEHVVRAVDALARETVGTLRLYVGDHPAQSTPARTREDVPGFVAFTNRVEVLDQKAGASVSIDFWRADEEGVRHAPRINGEADSVGASSWRAWLDESARSVTGLPLWNSVDFPIDAVFTWVDDTDPAWRAKRDLHRAQTGSVTARPGSDGSADDRFINRDEIYYSVAAARQNLPWLRRIIVVSDGQRHARIEADFPDVEFVNHREIFVDTDALPVFNSHAIEACLHRIPGLAEHFIYLNDDVFVTRPMSATDFFDANGVARFFPSELKVDFDDDGSAEPHLLAAANNRQLMARDFGIEITNSMLHTPYAHSRSVLEEMEQRYAEEFDRTRRSRFRGGGDISVMSSFAQYYGWATQRSRPGLIEYRFVRLHATDLESRMQRVLSDDSVQVVCIGEPLPHQSRHDEESRLVLSFMEGLAR
ncbi:MAG: stealth conserved region 3 domain-containing protein [Demequina sp.]